MMYVLLKLMITTLSLIELEEYIRSQIRSRQDSSADNWTKIEELMV